MFKDLKIDRLKTTETAIVIAIGLLIVAWKYQNQRLVILAIAMLVLSLIIPIIFYPLAKLWFGLGLLLGLVMTKILLTLIFLLIVTPIGFIRQLLGKDTLALKKFKLSEESVFVIKNQKVIPDDLKNQF